jgi:hypothetical protein
LRGCFRSGLPLAGDEGAGHRRERWRSSTTGSGAAASTRSRNGGGTSNSTARRALCAGRGDQRARAEHRIDLKYEDQTLAVYPADVMPAPWPGAQPLDREEGIRRYRALLTPEEYRNKLARGEIDDLTITPRHRCRGPPPVFPVILSRRDDLAPDVVRFEFTDPQGRDLPPWTRRRACRCGHRAGIPAPVFAGRRSGGPVKYVLGVLREADGRGGSALMHRVSRGARVFISYPRNHFPLDERPPIRCSWPAGSGSRR